MIEKFKNFVFIEEMLLRFILLCL